MTAPMHNGAISYRFLSGRAGEEIIGARSVSRNWHRPLGVLATALSLVLAPIASLHADTNSRASDEIPPLHPPRPEIQPTFWERNAVWIAGGSLGFVAGAVALLLLLTRPKPEEVLPPEARARRELERLRRMPEDGAVLSRVSQVLRRYYGEAFEVPNVELTTTEFCGAISDLESVGTELAGTTSDFLRGCDQRKFSPAPPPAFGAVEQAFKLIKHAEERRAQHLARQADSPQGP